MSDSQLAFDSTKTGVRIALFAAIATCVAFAFFGVRWQLGSMLAEQTPPGDPNLSEIAEVARNFAPADSRARGLAAVAANREFDPDRIDVSTALFGQAVRLSPNDFRWWVEYGRALEQAGRAGDAESALETAIQFAPNYAQPRWQLGNFYLRQGRTDEAFRELSRATSNNATYREQVFALVWDYSGNDPGTLEQTVSSDPEIHADLALFYMSRGWPADALRLWRSIPDERKPGFQKIAKTIADLSTHSGALREGLEFANGAGFDLNARPEEISNSGFESMLGDKDETYFGWKVDRGDSRAEFTPDSYVKHSDTRSLRIVFKNYDRPVFSSLWQNVAAQPNTKYSLSFWVRTETLRSGGPPQIEVADASANKVLAVSTAFPLGTNTWTQITLEFSTPDKSDGIYVRSSRGYCGETCPIVGTAWLDDFKLTKQ